MLPEELIDSIVCLIPPSELFALCLANSRMYAISVPHIYRAVKITHPDDLIAFCAALQERPMLSDDLRDHLLTLKNPGRSNPLYNRKVHAVCASAIGTLQNLDKLTIRYVPYLLPLLPSFPQLSLFRSSFAHEIGVFLRANPHIQSLHIGHMRVSTHSRVQLPRVEMPFLKTFIGPEVVARAVLPYSSVECPRIQWDLRRRQDRRFMCLRRLDTCKPMVQLDNHMSCYHDPHPCHISNALPGLRVLTFRVGVRTASLGVIQRFFDALAMSLSTYTDLYWIEVSQLCQTPPLTDTTFDHEWELLCLWHSLCPTLESCVMPSGVAWERAVEYPALAALWLPTDVVAMPPELVTWMQSQAEDPWLRKCTRSVNFGELVNST
ncbi:hypothetical protein C8R43DRAFT_964768 [Mycena crocata]|nr:hypothetical protein C8R43DRAFT_964768 [Mycena crocata]